MLTATLTSHAFAAPSPIVNRSLPYLNYIAGCDADSEPFTELAYELGQLFEGSYVPQAIAQALRALNPQVLLIDMEEDGLLRPDYPTLSDADTDAVDLRALEIATQVTCG